MSAPAVNPRPGSSQRSRPTRPVQRAAPARATPARAATARTVTSRTAPSRPVASRTAPSRTAPGRSTPTRSTPARTAPARAAAAATVGATALALPGAVPSTGATSTGARSRMRLLERPRTTSRRVGFAVTCLSVLGALMLGLLLLNVAISGNAFTVAELQSQRSLLVDQQQSLEQQLLVQGSPSALAERARSLGMVPAPQVLVLAPDGTGAPPVAPPPSP